MKANMTWITDNLATGGDLSWVLSEALEQQADIIDSGVTHILDLRIEDNDTELWMPYSVTYLNLGTEDVEGHEIPPSLFDDAVEFARDAEADGCKILVHCHMGVNRGPSVAAAILMDRGMDAVDALNLIREKRDVAALYYLLDAYDAHIAREGRPKSRKDRRRVSMAWEKVAGDIGVIQHVNRYIKGQRDKDRQAFR